MVDIYGQARVYFVAAALGAHSNMGREGFRQKDVRFLLGLFFNWMDATTKGLDEAIHNTQVSRYLENLVRSGFASKRGRGRAPRYQLTRAGLLELTGQLCSVPLFAPLEQIYFVHYFVRTYSTRLTEMVAQWEDQLPRSLRIELEARLDAKEILQRQIRQMELEVRKLESRIREATGAAQLAEKMARESAGSEEIIRAVESKFPYDLNNQKPMSELLYEIPAELRAWELTVGNSNRAQLLWGAYRDYLVGYVRSLRDLAKLEI